MKRYASTGTRTTSTQTEHTGDVDRVGDRHYDYDDDAIRDYGHPAGVTDARTISALVKRYYSVAAGLEGRAACSLMYSLVSESIVEDYGGSLGPPALRGNTCGVVMSKLFKLRHKQIAADRATLRVTGVRVDRNRAYALLSTSAIPLGYILVRREHGAWKIGEIFGDSVG